MFGIGRAEKRNKQILELEKKLDKCKVDLEAAYKDLNTITEERKGFLKEATKAPPESPERLRLAKEMERCTKRGERAQANVSKQETLRDLLENQIDLAIQEKITTDIGDAAPSPEEARVIAAGAIAADDYATDALKQAKDAFGSISANTMDDSEALAKTLAEIEAHSAGNMDSSRDMGKKDAVAWEFAESAESTESLRKEERSAKDESAEGKPNTEEA